MRKKMSVHITSGDEMDYKTSGNFLTFFLLFHSSSFLFPFFFWFLFLQQLHSRIIHNCSLVYSPGLILPYFPGSKRITKERRNIFTSFPCVTAPWMITHSSLSISFLIRVSKIPGIIFTGSKYSGIYRGIY